MIGLFKEKVRDAKEKYLCNMVSECVPHIRVQSALPPSGARALD